MNTNIKTVIFLAVALLTIYTASADVATAPVNLSPKGLADWAIVGGTIGSGTGALPAAGPVGSRYTDLTDPTKPLEYRSNGSAWVAVSSTGGTTATITAGLEAIASDVIDVDDALDAHMNDSVDPHGSDMTVTERVTIGSGTEDCYTERVATGTIGIGSYTQIIPEAATPTTLLPGLLWMDSNTDKLRCYDGSAWHDLW